MLCSMLTVWLISAGADESIHVHVVASAHRGITIIWSLAEDHPDGVCVVVGRYRNVDKIP